jgi:ABC-type glycerol-3-phosphate transport system permease component
MQDIRRLGDGRTYGALLPLNEPHPLFALSLQQGPVLDDGDSRGAFSQPPFRRALDFYAGLFRDDLAPRMARRKSPTCGTSSRAASSPSTSPVPGTSASSGVASRPSDKGTGRTAPLPGPDGPGLSTAGGSSLVIFKGSRRKEAAWKLISFLSEPETMQRFHALTGDLPPRRSAWRAPALADDLPSQAFARQLERVRAAPKIPEWERIFQEMQLTAERVVQGRQGPRGRLPRARRPGSSACSRSAAGCAPGGHDEARRRRLDPGGTGAARDRVFFALPVAAGLALSLTDFDLYALADLSTLRFVGLQNYAQLLQTPLFWQALVNTLYFVVVGVPVSIGLSLAAALLLDSRFAAGSRSFAPRCSRRWSRPPWPWP